MSLLRKLSVLGVTLGLVLCGSSAANAVGLSVPNFKQENTQWCWAAASQILIKYTTGTKPSQCSIVKKGKNSSACENKPGTFTGDVERALGAYKVKNGTVLNYAGSETTIQVELGKSRPVMVRYGYKPWKTTGHMVVIKGYEWNAQSRNYRYSWQDPGTGTTRAGTHAYLKDNSVWNWTHTRIGIAKK